MIVSAFCPALAHWRQAYFLVTAFKRKAFNAQAAWLRCLNGAAFASLKKYPSDFFNPPLADQTCLTAGRPNEVPYETTGNNVE